MIRSESTRLRRLIFVLADLLPKCGFTPGKQRVFAGIPTQEMACLRVHAMMLAAGPHFVQEKRAGQFGAAVQIVSEAPLLATRRPHKGAQLGFKQQLLPLFCAQIDDQRDGIFRQLWIGFRALLV